MPQTVPRSDVTHRSGRKGVLSLQEKDPAGPWDLGRRDPDPSNDEAAVRVVP
ncbi:hypothetical protein ACIP2Y_34405 [Streptomyces sviceus]|uniref:hypothetical protein n=1 Tax=Streptomyces sviceus TaxID=285530 RepID=UPI0038076824